MLSKIVALSKLKKKMVKINIFENLSQTSQSNATAGKHINKT